MSVIEVTMHATLTQFCTTAYDSTTTVRISTGDQLEALDNASLIALILAMQEQVARLEADSWASTRPAGEEQQE